MKNQKLIQDNKGNGTVIKIPPGYKTLKIIRFEASGDYSFEQSLGRIRMTTNLDDKPNWISLDQSLCKVENGSLIYSLDQNVPINKETSFKFRHMETLGFDGTLTMHYELLEIPEIPLSNPEEEFQAHLENYDNAKIVFSAPFGSGKSYFLDYFFGKRETEYEVFKVYPVNYSVASNEDIFKYIKADLLFQLMGKDVEFDKVEFSNKEHWQSFLFFNSDKIIIDTFHKLSHLDPTTTLFSKAVLAIEKLGKKVDVFKSQHQQDDFGLARKYLELVFEKEGSLYEDNFYTQMIRQLLERLKESHSKKSVLVIEDLDRMDPDHVFRILNVISAHYDTFKYDISQEDENAHNKFGFDKIIVVCDVKNIKTIFDHRYGEKADFAGYFNKFFSSAPFEFDNKQALRLFLDMIYAKRPSREVPEDPFRRGYITMLNKFHSAEVLNLRELICLNNNSFSDFEEKLKDHFHSKTLYYFFKGNYGKSIAYLYERFGYNGLLAKLKKVKQKEVSIRINYYEQSLNLLASIGKEVEPNKIYVEFDNLKFNIGVGYGFDYDDFEQLGVIDVLSSNNSKGDPKMELAHYFYDLLIANLNFYHRIVSKILL